MAELTREFAEKFANSWIEAWNAHDLKRIFSLYEDDFRMSSPYISERMGVPAGALIGKDNIRPYWEKSLQLDPPIRFVLEDIYLGVSSIVLQYKSVGRRRVCETFTFGESGKVTSGCSQHGPAL
ncbi:MAG: nuclear transport factor 2 family protein [Cellvibrionaceae bacterium]